MSESEQPDWQKLPADPEPGDLGYEPLQLVTTEPSTDEDRYVIHPRDEDSLREAAYILTDETSLLNLRDMV